MKKDFFNSFPPLFSISHLVEMGLLVRDLDSHSSNNEQGRENCSERKAEFLEVSVTWRFQKEAAQPERIGSRPQNKHSIGLGTKPSSFPERDKDVFLKAAA